MEIGGHGTAGTGGGPTKMNVDQTKAPNQNPPVGASSPTVDFKQLAQQNAAIGLNDEMRRLQETVATLRIQSDEHKAFALNQTEHLRQLQTHMGTLESEKKTVQEENEHEPSSISGSLLQRFYSDVSKAPSTFDLNVCPIFEAALEGALLILNIMHARHVEFKSLSKTIDLFHSRPTTAFSNEVRTLQDLKLDPSIPSHAFFLASYMSFKVDTDFVEMGTSSIFLRLSVSRLECLTRLACPFFGNCPSNFKTFSSVKRHLSKFHPFRIRRSPFGKTEDSTWMTFCRPMCTLC
jgi:hypothetical protein